MEPAEDSIFHVVNMERQQNKSLPDEVISWAEGTRQSPNDQKKMDGGIKSLPWEGRSFGLCKTDAQRMIKIDLKKVIQVVIHPIFHNSGL